MKLIYQSIVACIFFSVLLCGVYPLVVTAFGKFFFSNEANGGLLYLKGGQLVGAKLIGQSFSKPEYFHGRPSAAGDKGYDASSSSGSNLGPSNQKFFDGLTKNIDDLLKDNPSLKKGEIPVDLVTTSASGLDPHISPEAAFVQADRVAQARKIEVKEIRSLIQEHIEGPQLKLLGESVVNVLLLNLDLDRLYPPKT